MNTNSYFISVTQAQQTIMQTMQTIDGFHQVAIRDALDKILAEDIASPLAIPPYTNSAMDGYAINSTDLPHHLALEVIDTAYAGHPAKQSLSPGTAIRIMTGAKLPDGADTVIMQEDTTTLDNNTDSKQITITDPSKQHQGQHIRHQGEEFQVGSVVFSAGRKISPADIALLATLGIAEIKVKRRLRVAFFSTGDELRSLGEQLEEGQIYDSNRYSLYAMLTRLDIEIIDMGIIADHPDAIEAAFIQASQHADAIISSGGVSVGDADYIKPLLEKMGHINFWKIAMKPGKPLAFGLLNTTPFFGLPGNPVSVMATFYQFVQPALLKLMGQTTTTPFHYQAKLQGTLKKHPGRTDYQRGILSYNHDNELCVQSTGHQGSHILSSMSKANCFIILPTEQGNVSEGEWVTIQPFAGWV